MQWKSALPLALVLVVLTAGCVSGPVGSPTPTDIPSEVSQSPTEMPTTATEASTPPPNRTVEFPDGPKERPERPETLTEESVGEFVKTHEYRYAYNQLWYNEHSEVHLDCELQSVTERDGWYEVTVSCTGYSNTGGETSGNETATELHADWFTQTFVYSLDENSLIRERADSDG